MVPTAQTDFKDLTTMKNMFLARYNPWGKNKERTTAIVEQFVL